MPIDTIKGLGNILGHFELDNFLRKKKELQLYFLAQKWVLATIPKKIF